MIEVRAGHAVVYLVSALESFESEDEIPDNIRTTIPEWDEFLTAV